MQKTRELLLALYGQLAEGWKIAYNTPVGTGDETILQRVVELLREFANKKNDQDLPNHAPVKTRMACLVSATIASKGK